MLKGYSVFCFILTPLFESGFGKFKHKLIDDKIN